MIQKPDLEQRIASQLNVKETEGKDEQIADAGRILTEIEKIDVPTAFIHVQNRIKQKASPIQWINVLSRAAAVLFFPLLIVASWLFFKQQNQVTNVATKYAMQEISCPPGMRSQVILPDGSRVWLNAESTIKFSVPFPSESRTIQLTGEAFFDVVKNPQQPFFVRSDKVGVKVYGTKFNFKAYRKDPNIEVILEEGRIGLGVTNQDEMKKTSLTPGDRAVIARESNVVDIKNEKIDKYIAWHTGKLVFENTPMSEVAQMLERWYGIEVIVQNPEIMDYSFTTTFDNESLFEVIELIELSSPIRIKYIPATIAKGNKPQTRSKVLIYKK